MGCDGGSIPKRAEMVKTKKKAAKGGSDSQDKFQTCFLSQVALKTPIVSDGLGRLFNKEAVLEWLMGDREIELEHIKSIKDFTNLHLTANPLYNSKDNSTLLSSSTAKEGALKCSPFMCPITQKEMNGTFKFIFPPCGCVVSELAIQNVKESNCLVCGKEYNVDSLIPIYPTDSIEIQNLLDKIQSRQNKSKKRKGDLQEPIKKKDNSSKKINMSLPNLSSKDLPFGMGPNSKTAVLESIFVKKDEKGQVIDDGKSQNFLVKGTFNRSAASF